MHVVRKSSWRSCVQNSLVIFFSSLPPSTLLLNSFSEKLICRRSTSSSRRWSATSCAVFSQLKQPCLKIHFASSSRHKLNRCCDCKTCWTGCWVVAMVGCAAAAEWNAFCCCCCQKKKDQRKWSLADDDADLDLGFAPLTKPQRGRNLIKALGPLAFSF